MSQRYLDWAGREAGLNDRALELLVEALSKSTVDRPATLVLDAWKRQYEFSAATAEISLEGMPEYVVRDLADLLENFLPEIERNMEVNLAQDIEDLSKFRVFVEHVVKPTARDLLLLITEG